jgi:hypothetical protein
LVGHRQQQLRIGILGGLPPAAHLLREQATLSAVTAQFSRIQAGGLQHHRELVGRSPTLRILLAGRDDVTLQAPGLAPLLEGDHVDVTWTPESGPG